MRIASFYLFFLCARSLEVYYPPLCHFADSHQLQSAGGSWVLKAGGGQLGTEGMRLAAAAACLSTFAALVALASRMRPSASELLLLRRGQVLAATPGARRAAFRVPRRAPVLSAGWLGEHWNIDGLEDDGRYMVPATPDADSSGNALFDFGPEGGLPLSKTTGEPVKGHLPDHRFRRTGTSEEHFPNEIYQFDIDGIRRDEDGYVPWWDRYRGFYSNKYPQYIQDYGFVEAPAVSVEDGHVTDIDDNQVRDPTCFSLL